MFGMFKVKTPFPAASVPFTSQAWVCTNDAGPMQCGAGYSVLLPYVPVVIGPRRWVVQRCEGGEEESAFEFPGAPLARMFSSDRRAPQPGRRSRPTASTGPGAARRGSASGEETSDGGAVQVRAQRPFKGRRDLGEQPADPVRRRGDLSGEVVVEPAGHRGFGQGFIVRVH